MSSTNRTKFWYIKQVGDVLAKSIAEPKGGAGLTVDEIRKRLGGRGSKSTIIRALKFLEKYGFVEPPTHYRLREYGKGEYFIPLLAEVKISGRIRDTQKRRGFARQGVEEGIESRRLIMGKQRVHAG